LIFVTLWVFVGIVAGILIVLYFAIGNLRRRIKTVAIYMVATGAELPELKEYVDKISQYLSVSEWEMV
jgi:hypothetical protein